MLLYFTYLDYEESGDAVYSAPGSPKCTQLSWTHNERHEDPGDMDEDEIETKLQEYRDQGPLPRHRSSRKRIPRSGSAPVYYGRVTPADL